MSRFPSFFLVGAPKAGTTALYHYLDQHPDIHMSPIKEPNFFAEEFRLENFSEPFRKLAEARMPAQEHYLKGPMTGKFSGGPISEWSDYGKLFQGARNETAIGEASVCYLWSKNAPQAIATRCGTAKILAVLRNPVERAFSQYAHMLSFAESPVTFAEFLDEAMASKDTRIGEYYPFLHFGFYYEQLKRYRSFFDPGQIQIHLYEDFRQAPKQVLREIFCFLDVDPEFEPDLSARHMESAMPRSYFLKNILKRLGIREALRGKLPPKVRTYVRKATLRPREALTMTVEDRVRLIDLYREDVRDLSELLRRDLSSWLGS